jgi:SNF2 family DNA or RNA helicase
MDGRLEELHSVMEFVYPGLLESRTRFLQKHAETDFWGKITGYKDIDVVRQRIAHCFIRRLKKDVLKDLPDKIYENRIVVLTPSEMKTYKELASRGHEVTKDVEAMVAVIRCKQFCDHPELICENGKTSSKLESLREVLDEVVVGNGHKVLVFSQYKQMVNILVRLFDEMSLKYLRIDGDTPKQSRADYQKQFNEDPKLDIMVGTEAMSTGLNFTSADFIINYDDCWAPAIMDQRSDRAHRIGQKNVVTVVGFICKDTIEERIRAVLYGKSVITAETLGDDVDDMVLRRLGPKDICKLL